MGFFRTLMGWVSGRHQREFIAALNELKREVAAVPVDDPKKEVLRHLADPSKFRCVSATSELVLPRPIHALPPLVTEFFTWYDSVAEFDGDVRLSRSEIGRSFAYRGFVRIGEDGGHFEVIVRPGTESVYVTDGLEAELGDGSLDGYPTLYHFLLCNIRFPDSRAYRLPS